MAANRRIAILGAGKIGESLLAGLLSSGWRKPGDIVVTGRREERIKEVADHHGVQATLSNADAVSDVGLVVIAVKPQDFDALLGEIGGLLTPEHTVLSVAAAITTAQIEARLASGVPVVRAMPNAPSLVHEGMAGVCAGAHAGDEHLRLAEDVLSHLGTVVRVPERAMDAVTAVSGSGPAYFALLAEGMIEAGILLGLSREVSTQLVVLDDAAAVAEEAARRIADAVAGGRSIVLTGGRTPERAYERAAALAPDWSGVEVWWGDERCVPPDDERSNYAMAKGSLLERVQGAPAKVHRIRGEL